MISFGPKCSVELANITNGAAGFRNYFDLTHQSSVTGGPNCDENLAANWRYLVQRDIINCGGRPSIMDFFVQSFPGMMGGTTKINAKTKYFKSQCAMEYNVQAGQAASGIIGQPVTFVLSRNDHSANGTLDTVGVGMKLLLKGTNTLVQVTAVNKTVDYAHTVTVQGPANYAINIKANTPMMVVPTIAVGSQSCHSASTLLPTQGHIYKMGMKIIRAGWEVPLDADLHCNELQFAKGIDPTTGHEIELWTTTAKEIKRAGMMLTKNTDILFGQKELDQSLIDQCLDGFNGLIPNIKYAGGNVMIWDPIYGLNPRTDLSIIISNADQTKSFKEYYCTCGFMYYAEIQAQLTKIVGANPGACTFQAFKRDGAVDKTIIEQFQIQTWSVLGYTFHFYVADAFTDIRTIGGTTLGNTAIYYPAGRVKDSAGNDVPPIDMYTYGNPMWDGTYKDVVRNMWELTGCKTIEGDMEEAYGMANHCLKDFYLHSPKLAC